jgi:hypothetical protein
MLKLRQPLPVCFKHFIHHLLDFIQAQDGRSKRVKTDGMENLPWVACDGSLNR